MELQLIQQAEMLRQHIRVANLIRNMKNKIVIIIIVFTTNFSCNSQDNKDIIKDFIESVVMKSSDTINNINTFLKVSEDSLKEDTPTFKLIEFNIQFLRNEIKSNSEPLEILTYTEFKNKDIFKDYKIFYEGKDELYCVVQGKKLINPILIDKNHKITAFFTGITKQKNNITPHIIEEGDIGNK